MSTHYPQGFVASSIKHHFQATTTTNAQHMISLPLPTALSKSPCYWCLPFPSAVNAGAVDDAISTSDIRHLLLGNISQGSSPLTRHTLQSVLTLAEVYHLINDYYTALWLSYPYAHLFMGHTREPLDGRPHNILHHCDQTTAYR